MIPELKIGDRVLDRATAVAGTVEGFCGAADDALVRFPFGSYAVPRGQLTKLSYEVAAHDELQRAIAAHKPPAPAFAVGDRIRHTGDTHLTGTIDRVGKAGGLFVKWDPGCSAYSGPFTGENLARLDPPAPRFRVGDRVQWSGEIPDTGVVERADERGCGIRWDRPPPAHLLGPDGLAVFAWDNHSLRDKISPAPQPAPVCERCEGGGDCTACDTSQAPWACTACKGSGRFGIDTQTWEPLTCLGCEGTGKSGAEAQRAEVGGAIGTVRNPWTRDSLYRHLRDYLSFARRRDVRLNVETMEHSLGLRVSLMAAKPGAGRHYEYVGVAPYATCQGDVESGVASAIRALDAWKTSARGLERADAEPPGPATESHGGSAPGCGSARTSAPLGEPTGTPAPTGPIPDYPHTCPCGAPCVELLVGRICSRAGCTGRVPEVEVEIAVEEMWTNGRHREDLPQGMHWEECFRAHTLFGDPPIECFAATREAAVAAVRRRLGEGR